MLQTWQCINTNASTTDCTVESTTTPDVSYHDWLFVNQVQIFLMGFIGVAMIFSIFSRRR